MTTLIHLSDLHFGTEREGLVEALLNDIKAINPDIIIVSGDLTQRARKSQFLAARKFLELLNEYPIISVPGNHDISLHNPIERFFYPFNSYEKWIGSEYQSRYHKNNIAIYGINSVTPYKSMSGYVTKTQLQNLAQYFKPVADDTIKITVMHHNLIQSERHKIINDSRHIIDSFAKARINLVLCGHIHQPCFEPLQSDYQTQPMYVITAGTAISMRTIEPNSYNVLKFEAEMATLEVREFVNNEFIATSDHQFTTANSK